MRAAHSPRSARQSPVYRNLLFSKRRRSSRPSVVIKSLSDSFFGAQCLFKRSDSPGKQNALEEAPEADSIPSGEARQRSKPRQRIPGPKGSCDVSNLSDSHRANDSAECHIRRRLNRASSACFGERWRRVMCCGQRETVFVIQIKTAELGFTDSRRVLKHCIEDRLKFARR